MDTFQATPLVLFANSGTMLFARYCVIPITAITFLILADSEFAGLVPQVCAVFERVIRASYSLTSIVLSSSAILNIFLSIDYNIKSYYTEKKKPL